MTNILPIPEWQIIDPNGDPVVGGTIATYIPGTLTAKATWQDINQTTQNTNPIVLDAAGRCIVFGSGDYRVIVKDALGNLIYDQLTYSGLPESAVSAVMLPVIGAQTLAQARTLMGIDDEINTVINNAVSQAIATEAGLRAAADAAEANARAATDASLQTQITNFYNGYVLQVALLQSEINAVTVSGSNLLRATTGHSASDVSGNVYVTWTPAFASKTLSFVVTPDDPGWAAVGVFFLPNTVLQGEVIAGPGGINTNSATGCLAYNQVSFEVQGSVTTALGSQGFTWVAYGF